MAHTPAVEVCEDRSAWDEFVLTHAGHPLQLWGWGEAKAAHGWRVERVLVRADGGGLLGGAQVLFRALPFPLKSLAYVPRGPVGPEPGRARVLEALAGHVRRSHGSVALTVEPDWTEVPAEAAAAGWRHSDNTILIPRTLILDLTKDEDELMKAMAKKTRQYIRKSAREDLELRAVTAPEELEACLVVYRQTAERAGFGLHQDGYYRDVARMLGEHSPVFAAFSGGAPAAFVWLAASAETAFELYGGMTEEGQRLRANYALKWHAIQAMRERGVRRYDVNGLLNDGISHFKQGFADHEDLLAGTWDRPLSPLYAVWDRGLPLARRALRGVGDVRGLAAGQLARLGRGAEGSTEG
ncbi:MAG TPA: peptidoglycan bridge formation glycyltransferase FemA/FemB family protein [Segeticoccus sp.]|uniref:lipid II:glycine glycyltransferase FemX n=1 Tax=Segeticoccus sp. TaxID=2706531 RepID=UPI002D8060DB|nr:peptidoglycan bridge formation glycyltransferase FemA/FemB family protein [Segeticoccus sp.]HET8600334.1 peptidoglycan bridge formation glycyltransferase FemA/FemB family protein [Segeticoccus sp.]